MNANELMELLRPGFEAAIIERYKESGFLEVEIRVECLTRCGDGYDDPVVASAWWAWCESRRTMVVQLPEYDETPDSGLFAESDVIAAIEAVGGTVKS